MQTHSVLLHENFEMQSCHAHTCTRLVLASTVLQVWRKIWYIPIFRLRQVIVRICYCVCEQIRIGQRFTVRSFAPLSLVGYQDAGLPFLSV
jgi:hypothetical protein